MNIFNKKVICSNGTLVGNWQEEQALRDLTGEGRAAVPEHIPKKMADFENPITHGKVFDSTHDRIHGQKRYELYQTQNHYYGTVKNPVDDFPKMGKRQELLESSIRRQVAQQILESEKERERALNARCWETTTKTDFRPADLTENPIGRKVMKTRDGICIPPWQRDEQFLVETKLGQRLPKSETQKLVEKVPKGHYAATQPVTFYTQHLERKNCYMSAATGPNPFAKTSAMTQPVQNTKAAKNYEGNVDFAKAQTSTNHFLRSKELYYPGQ